ncbi:MAG TPA: ABC transporter permease [Candidatus Bathyarchaeia archaeon]|nr:ABC transporter permease [Candidatus Bathyarchaeia archaeon]
MIELSETIKIAFSALKANKTRSFLTMLGIVIGVSSVILLLSIGTGLKNYITKQLSELGSNTVFVMPGNIGLGSDGGNTGSTPGAGAALPKFTERHLSKLKSKAKTIKYIMPYIESNASLKYQSKTHITQLSGVGSEYPEIRNQNVIEGSFFTPSQERSSKRVVILGTKAAEELFGNQDPIGKKITISDQRYTVIGVLEEKGGFAGVSYDDLAFAPWTTVMDLNELEYIQSFWIVSESAETVSETKQEIEDILLEDFEKEDFSVLDTKSLLDTISSILSVLTAALGGIAAISLLVGGIGIMNIMLVSVTERTREIGLRKAVGAPPRAILIQFIAEAVIFSVCGGLIGIIIGVLGSLAINYFIQTTIAPWAIILSFGVSSLVGIIFGVAPAAKAARLDPITALRYE